jgi:hypothetical protein
LEVEQVAAEVFAAVVFAVPTVDVVIYAVSAAESFVFAVLTVAAASVPAEDLHLGLVAAAEASAVEVVFEPSAVMTAG